MLVLRNYLFVLGIFAAVSTASEAFSQGSFGGLDYVNFMMDEFSYLNITSLGRNLLEHQSDCGFACLEIPPCISYNVAAFPDIDGKLLCELLPSDKYNNSDKFISSQYFHHFSIPSPCSSSPCKNNGKCVSLYDENSYKCVCKEGFTGQNCETNINECESNPCLNNGTCTDRVNGFNCTCPPGFAGNRCEIDINECESSPCLNNGTCTDQVNGFNCSCPPGITGNRCEIDINECESNPCLNNGTCTDRVNGFNCTCQPGFTGNRCNETDVSINSPILAQFLAPVVGNNTKWVLCYRATVHGWAASTFHSRCDGKPNTVTIITNGPYVFGGYTDVPWDSSNNYKSTPNSFIFSLRNKEELAPFKSNVTNPQYAIFCHSSYGPVFGNGWDIGIYDNANSNSNSYTVIDGSYYALPSGVKDGTTILAGTQNFSPDEVEVFYLG